MNINRIDLKNEAKSKLKGKWGYAILLALIELIFAFIYGTGAESSVHQTGTYFGFAFIGGIIYSLIVFGTDFVLLDFFRNTEKKREPVLQFVRVYQEKGLFSGTLVIAILVYIWTYLWSLLLIVPGVIKGLAYSQAHFIYRDHLEAGEKIGYTQAVTESREMMDGHKWELFVLGFSFLGWILLGCITAGIAFIWVLPYIQLTTAGYYQKLKELQASDQYVA
ncbi:DUF975 family protein [Eupransor demetentiae]|uniref:Uncharacterized membrane protein n=1 Tax=Eupransor demetentiae TaxID=3109584 RepID=A0ABM9N328_9LACO|nr:Uncharacterized membrane protein [Lactobacillaceae bacterium LMG 33000]